MVASALLEGAGDMCDAALCLPLALLLRLLSRLVFSLAFRFGLVFDMSHNVLDTRLRKELHRWCRNLAS